MWQRYEFLANERVAEKTRRIVEAARIRDLLGSDDAAQVHAMPVGGSARRTLARLVAAGARAAMAAATRLDPGTQARA